MTKNEIIKQLTEKSRHLDLQNSEKIVNMIFDLMAEAISSGDIVDIEGFGNFSIEEDE